MFRRFANTRFLCLSAIIAALYAALTLMLPVLSYGAWQCRLSEALTLLPLVLPQSVPGLFVGCLIANILSPMGIWDVVFGSLATLIAAIGTYALRKRPPLAAACPVLSNGVIVGLMLSVVYSLPAALTMLQVAAGEALAVAVGYVLIRALKGKIDWKRLQ
ncbi:MAG: QueT transporter family protein [Clostridiales bacterium]|nr:QueT transporter family protein [Clostridiales bacterium]